MNHIVTSKMRGSDFCGEVGKLGGWGRGLRSGSEAKFGVEISEKRKWVKVKKCVFAGPNKVCSRDFRSKNEMRI